MALHLDVFTKYNIVLKTFRDKTVSVTIHLMLYRDYVYCSLVGINTDILVITGLIQFYVYVAKYCKATWDPIARKYSLCKSPK
jgi:hypothetical protein